MKPRHRPPAPSSTGWSALRLTARNHTRSSRTSRWPVAESYSTCKRCPAQILWVASRGGKAMPLDAEPVPDGNIWLDHEGFARYLKKGEVPPEGALRYVSHFSSCPFGPSFRKGK